MTPAKYKRYADESPVEYQYRVSCDKDIIGTWQDVADIINAELGYEYGECKYRKDFVAFNKLFAANRTKLVNADERLAEIEKKEFELRKATQKFYDQRRSYNRIATQEARSERFEEQMANAATALRDVCPILPRPIDGCMDVATGNDCNEAVLFFSDWHYGMVASNIFNHYDTQVCRDRVRRLVDEAKIRLKRHRPSKLHIVLLGDCAHGAIHPSVRVESEELVCDQLMQVSELIAEAIDELSFFVPTTEVHSTYGNHLRTIQEKKDSVHADNMEKIVSWWLKSRFSNCSNIIISDSEFFEFIWLKVCDQNVCCTHGDLDNIKNIGPIISTIFSRIYGEPIDYTVSADKHHIESFDNLGIESYTVPSLCGADSYANEHRLYAKPAQTMMFFTFDGLDAVYNIKL